MKKKYTNIDEIFDEMFSLKTEEIYNRIWYYGNRLNPDVEASTYVIGDKNQEEFFLSNGDWVCKSWFVGKRYEKLKNQDHSVLSNSIEFKK